MNYKTNALTTEQYTEIIETMKQGFTGFEPNERIATALVLEGNLGLRISDVLRLRLADIVKEWSRKQARRGFSQSPSSSSSIWRTTLCVMASDAPRGFSPLQKGRSRNSFHLCATIWAMRASAPTASASGMPPRFIRTVAMMLPWSSASYSIAPQPSPSATLA